MELRHQADNFTTIKQQVKNQYIESNGSVVDAQNMRKKIDKSSVNTATILAELSSRENKSVIRSDPKLQELKQSIKAGNAYVHNRVDSLNSTKSMSNKKEDELTKLAALTLESEVVHEDAKNIVETVRFRR